MNNPAAGVWVVADGLGGHSHGEVASRMVCDAFTDFPSDSTFADAVADARERLQRVNDQLVHAASGSIRPIVTGSTVVALMARESRCAVLWAGDSRAYRWRNGRLLQMTRDHSVAEDDGTRSTAITRAVGGEATLALDQLSDIVHPGDRFLLCSDGLTRAVVDREIERYLGSDDIQTAVDSLIRAALEAGAPDNVTAVVTEAF